MLPQRLLARSSNILLGATCLATSALAGAPTINTQCHTAGVPLQNTNWSSSVSVPKFNPLLGTLQSISFKITGEVQGSIKAESLDAQPTVINSQLGATMTLTRPDLSVIVVTLPVANFSDPVTAFDGMIDFMGTSGVTHANLVATDSDMVVSPPPLSDLVLFTGVGNITLGVSAAAVSTASGPGNVVTQFSTMGKADVEVCYTYEVNQPPEFTQPTCQTTIMATAGVPVSFQVCADDDNTLDMVTLAPVLLPLGATFNPNPAIGNPACGTLDWTPSLNQLGDTQICFVATDTHGRASTCCVTVSVAECFQALGRGAGNYARYHGGTLWTTQLDIVRQFNPVTMTNRPSMAVPILTSGSMVFAMQTLMHNTIQFPNNTYQWSNRTRITVLPGGVVTGELFGTINGIHQSVTTFTDPSGQLRMTFPFTIDGM